MPRSTARPSPEAAIRAGDVEALERLLADDPSLASARVGPRTLLHIATDWPGGLPRVADTIRVLAAAGADVDARFGGTEHDEAPLHWAASADDVPALDALLDAGADIDAGGGVIGGGTPLNDATAFGQWRAARRLVERGARVSWFDAAALGLLDRLEDVPDDELDGALWGAAHGGQPAAVELLLARGADPGWVGWDELTPLGAAQRSGAADVVALLSARRS
jgi:uncharacterized protein